VKLLGRNQIVYESAAVSLGDAEAFRKHQLSVLGEIRHANRRAGRAIWTSVVLMGCWTALMFTGAAYLAPLMQKRIETHYIAVDRVNGYIQEVSGITDVPKMFSEANAEHEIKEYVEYYYDYTWEDNRKHEDKIRMLSSADQLARYKKWADEDATSPKQRLAHHGSTETAHMLFYKQGDGDAETHEYLVKFSYRETSNGRTEPGWHNYTGHIQFQWHPELVKDAEWASDNPGGFFVTYFKADEDPK